MPSLPPTWELILERCLAVLLIGWAHFLAWLAWRYGGPTTTRQKLKFCLKVSVYLGLGFFMLLRPG